MSTYTVEGRVLLTVRMDIDALSEESALSEAEARIADMLENTEGFTVDENDLYVY